MKLEPTLLSDVLRLTANRMIPPEEAHVLSDQLGSTQEFLAWLFIRYRLDTREPQIGHYLVLCARTNVVSAETRRERSGFPIDERQSWWDLERAILEALSTESQRKDAEKALLGTLTKIASSASALDQLTRIKVGIEIKD